MRFWLLLLAPGMAQDWSSQPEQVEVKEGVRYAVVVGIKEYDHGVEDLRFADKDAQEMAELLEAEGWMVKPLVGKVTKNDFTEALIPPKDEHGRDLVIDTFLLYFSGHGSLELPDGEPRLYLMASNSSYQTLSESALALTNIRRHIRSLDVPQSVFILDTCHSGKGKSELREETRDALRDLKGEIRERSARPKPYEVRLHAADLLEPAKEADEEENGLYTAFLLESLREGRGDVNQDGCIEALEAHDYAAAQVKARDDRLIAANEPVFRQNPWVDFTRVGVAKVALVGTCDTARQGTLFPGSRLTYRYDGHHMKGPIGTEPGLHSVGTDEEDPIEVRAYFHKNQRAVVSEILHYRRSRLLYGLGGSWRQAMGEAYLQEASPHLSLTWLPRDNKGGRLALGLETGLAFWRVGPYEGFFTGHATGHLAWLWGHRMLWGPTAHGGIAWRDPDTEAQSGGLFGAGLQIRVVNHWASLTLEPRIQFLQTEDGWNNPLPGASVTLAFGSKD